MPLPIPRDSENRSEFISRCVSDQNIQNESSSNEQALAICSSIWDDNKMNDSLLKRIRERQQKKTEFGYGILTADKHVANLQNWIGLDSCYRYASKGNTSFNDLMEKAKNQLVYSNEDMSVTRTGKSLNVATSQAREFVKEHVDEEIEIPKNTLMVFRHVLTTSTKDRDGDILRTDGAEVDPKMLLLWQHVHTLPIGKMISIAEHTANKLTLVSAIVDMNELCHDAAVMVDNDMARFSHGFRALEFEDLKEEEGQTTSPGGFDVKKFEIMEESIVSVPANVGAEQEEVILSLVEGGKLTSGIMKDMGKTIREHRNVSVPVNLDLKVTVNGEEIKSANEPRNRSEEEGERGKGYSSSKEADETTTKEAEEASGTQVRPRLSRLERERIKRSINGVSVNWCRSSPKDVKYLEVDKEELIAAKLEYEWCAKFIGCNIKDLIVTHTGVSGIRVGTFFSAMENFVEEWKLHDTRNITSSGEEIPPQREVIQLNSRLRQTFLIEGMRFFKTKQGNVVLKVQKGWSGYTVTAYAKDNQGNEFFDRCWEWTRANNYLKGEAFSLTGDFLERGSDSFSDVFLESKNKEPVTKLVNRINVKGKKTPNRGMIMMGPPGTGKTLSGRIMMNTAKATFIWVSAKDFWRSGAIGGLCSAFDLAREFAPSIVFVEDVDNWLSDHAIDVIKTEMDGISRSTGVTTILTTNYPDRLPDALIDRPGRFHDVLNFDLPNESIRKQMLVKWTGLSDMRLTSIAKKTSGYSGAHLYELAYYARTIAEEDNIEIDKALVKALEKIDSQRELINQSQLSGSNYKPRSTEVAISKSFVQRTISEVEKRLSKRAVETLKNVVDDMKELQDMDGLTRAGNALCERCVKRVQAVIKEHGPAHNDEEDEDKTIDAKEAMATFLIHSTDEQKQEMKRFLEAIENTDKTKSLTEQYRAFVGTS